MNKERLSLYIAHKDIMLTDAMQKIDINASGTLFIIDEDERLCAVVSDGDIRRWIIKTADLQVPVSMFMNTSPKYLHKSEKHQAVSFMQKKNVRILPLVDDEKHIVDFILSKDAQEISVKNKDVLKDVFVVIMAGGKGTRLYPYTKILPKPLIPIGDVPIMERIIDCFCEYGIRDFYVTVNYKKGMIQSYFADLDSAYELHYVEEDKPLGTAGSIRLIPETFDKPIFVTNCDIMIREDYSEIYNHHVQSGNVITVVAAMKSDEIPYGVIESKENGEIIQMEEKPSHTYFVNTGMYVINPDMIDLIPKDTLFHMTHLTNKALEKGWKVGMFPISEDSFLDMGEIEEMKRMEEKLNL